MNTEIVNSEKRRCQWFVSSTAKDAFRRNFNKERLSDNLTLVNITEMSSEVEQVGVSPDGGKDLYHSLTAPKVFFVVSRDIRPEMKDKVLVTCLPGRIVKTLLDNKLIELVKIDEPTDEQVELESSLLETSKRVDAIMLK